MLHLRDNGELQTGWPRRCVREVAVLAVSIDGELRRGERRGTVRRGTSAISNGATRSFRAGGRR